MIVIIKEVAKEMDVKGFITLGAGMEALCKNDLGKSWRRVF